MKRACLVSLVIFAAPLFSTSSIASEDATRYAVKDAQTAERIIAAAVRTGDFDELRRQGSELVRIISRIPESEDVGTRVSCASAIQSLRNLASDLSSPGQARKAVAAEGSRSDFLEAMPQCERKVGLKAPAKPNLRR